MTSQLTHVINVSHVSLPQRPSCQCAREETQHHHARAVARARRRLAPRRFQAVLRRFIASVSGVLKALMTVKSSFCKRRVSLEYVYNNWSRVVRVSGFHRFPPRYGSLRFPPRYGSLRWSSPASAPQCAQQMEWQGDQASPIFVCIFLDIFFVGFFGLRLIRGVSQSGVVGLDEKQRH